MTSAIGDCRLMIDGLTIAGCRLTDCRLSVGRVSIEAWSIYTRHSVAIANRHSVARRSPIVTPSIGNRQSAVANV